MTRKLFDDTVALVSGASQGIGKAIALALLDAGCRVAITDIRQDRAEQAARQSGHGPERCRAYALDVREAAQCEAVAADLREHWARWACWSTTPASRAAARTSNPPAWPRTSTA